VRHALCAGEALSADTFFRPCGPRTGSGLVHDQGKRSAPLLFAPQTLRKRLSVAVSCHAKPKDHQDQPSHGRSNYCMCISRGSATRQAILYHPADICVLTSYICAG
jgi:hypothetical protein